MSRILSAHQPAYLPWLGYFDKIKKSDVFVYLDDVQFETNSFINRNQIKTPQGLQWLTVPVHTSKHLSKTVSQTMISNEEWKRKHLKAIELNYKRAPFFEIYYPVIVDSINLADTKSISDVCWSMMYLWQVILSLWNTQIVRSSSLGLEDLPKSLKLVEMCKKLNSNVYLSGINGKNYIDEEIFRKEGIKVLYQNYFYVEYPQLWGNFVPNLSIIDFLMNVGNVRLV